MPNHIQHQSPRPTISDTRAHAQLDLISDPSLIDPHLGFIKYDSEVEGTSPKVFWETASISKRSRRLEKTSSVGCSRQPFLLPSWTSPNPSYWSFLGTRSYSTLTTMSLGKSCRLALVTAAGHQKFVCHLYGMNMRASNWLPWTWARYQNASWRLAGWPWPIITSSYRSTPCRWIRSPFWPQLLSCSRRFASPAPWSKNRV